MTAFDELELKVQGIVVMANEALAAFNDYKQSLLAGAGGAVKQLTVYGQRDAPWGNEKLGSGSSYIYQDGCLITSMASIITDAGNPMTPGQMNSWLIANHGYVSDNHFVFAAPDSLGVVKYIGLYDCQHVSAPIAEIDKIVAGGGYVIVKVKVSNTVPQHWMRWLGGGQVMDPYHAEVAPITSRYGQDAAKIILAYVVYKPLTGV